LQTELEQPILNQLFTTARSYNSWTTRAVTDEQIRSLYDLVKMGPTSANACPARFVWVKSHEAKTRLATLVAEGNKTKILTAPVTVIIAYDLNFREALPKLFPDRAEALKRYFEDSQLAEVTAIRNGSLQGAYLIMAARALGLDCGPMSGFDNAAVDREFFPGSSIRSNFLCGLGYGAKEKLFPRQPRLSFSEASRVV
jgi:3-hydroxypropanoate dehydrogenase